MSVCRLAGFKVVVMEETDIILLLDGPPRVREASLEKTILATDLAVRQERPCRPYIVGMRNVVTHMTNEATALANRRAEEIRCTTRRGLELNPFALLQ